MALQRGHLRLSPERRNRLLQRTRIALPCRLIQGYEEVSGQRLRLPRYSAFYTHSRLHQAFGYRTPAEVHETP
jgi:hypothetical protein